MESFWGLTEKKQRYCYLTVIEHIILLMKVDVRSTHVVLFTGKEKKILLFLMNFLVEI